MRNLYQWRGRDEFNDKHKGKVLAQNSEEALKILTQRGFNNIRLFRVWQFSYAPTIENICDFFAQWSVLLNAQIPLKQGLQLLKQNAQNPVLDQWLADLLSFLNQGYRLSESLERSSYSCHFIDEQEHQLLKTGEMTGQLANLCQQISVHKQQKWQLKKKIQKILLYPLVVLIISALLTLGLVIFIVPQFAALYGEQSDQLPFFTQLLLDFSVFLRQYGLIFLLGIISFWLILKVLKKRSKRGKKTINWHFLLPFFSEFSRLSRQCNFALAVALMLDAGISLPLALQSFLPYAQEQDKRLYFELNNVLKRLHQGYAFSASLSPNFFSQTAMQMLQIGEQTGQLSKMLQRIGQDAQQKLDHQIELLSQLIEPLLMVVIGLIIGVIMLAMYLPIFNLGSLIQ